LQYKYVVLTNTTLGSFMALLDGNIVLISLPTIIAQLPGTTTIDGIWILMGYTLITATLLLTFGRLSDVFGRVRLYNLGFATFTIGSVLCSVSPDGVALVGFRLIQGLGAALLFSNSAALLTDVFPPSERGRAIGINQIAGTAGSVGGLVAGGILTSTLGWRSIFWINIPVGIFATIWAFTKLKEVSTPTRSEGLDPLGNGLFALGLSLFLLGLTLGSLLGWTAVLAGSTIGGIAVLGVFLLAETKSRFPMMDLSLFKVRSFTAGIASNLLASVSRGALSLVLVVFLQGVVGLSALAAGLYLIPFSIAFVTFGPLSGYLSDRYGPRGFMTGGALLTTVSLFWFAIFPFQSPSYSYLIFPMVLAGIGGGLFIAPNVASIMNSVPVARRGVASGMSSTLINTGYLLSLGAAFAIMASSVPIPTLQAIFAGETVKIGEKGLSLFVGSMHSVFLLMGVFSLFAAFAASLSVSKRSPGDSPSTVVE
jgi:EmrB/QacA subfamily drug resistance transporter